MAAPYVGNADFRGYLAYLGKNGDQRAQSAISGYNGLGYVNNSGQINRGVLNELYTSPMGGADEQQSQQAQADYINGLYSQYGNLNKATAGGGSAGTAQDQADEAAYWQDQIDQSGQQLGRLDAQQNSGLANILGSYQSAYGALQGQRATAERDYNTNKQNTIDQNVTARNGVDTTVRNTNNSAQRLLGGRGAGSSSASQILAPYAAALQGGQQRQAVQNTYGKNMQALDTTWGDTTNKFDDSFGDLLNQKSNQENQLRSGVATSRAQLLQQQADAAVSKRQATGASYQTARAARTPYTQQITQLLNNIDQLGTNVNFTPKSVAFQAPTLDQYAAPQQAAPTVSNSPVGPGAAGALGSYFNLIAGKDKKTALV